MNGYERLVNEIPDLDKPMIESIKNVVGILNGDNGLYQDVYIVVMSPIYTFNKVFQLDLTKDHIYDTEFHQHLLYQIVLASSGKKILFLGKEEDLGAGGPPYQADIELFNGKNGLSEKFDFLIISDISNEDYQAILPEVQKHRIKTIFVPQQVETSLYYNLRNTENYYLKYRYSGDYYINRFLACIDDLLSHYEGILVSFPDMGILYGEVDAWMDFIIKSIRFIGKTGLQKNPPYIYMTDNPPSELSKRVCNFMKNLNFLEIEEINNTDKTYEREDWHGKVLLISHLFRVYVDTEQTAILFTAGPDIPRTLRKLTFFLRYKDLDYWLPDIYY